MVYISEKQVLAMHMIGKIAVEFGEDRWFTKYELPGITKHSLDALVFKRFLKEREVWGVIYYRRLKELDDES